VSPYTRFDARETNATHFGATSTLPLTAGLYEGPLAGNPRGLRVTRRLPPGRQRVPFVPHGDLRSTVTTSV
jgi:hypothetical protein